MTIKENSLEKSIQTLHKKLAIKGFHIVEQNWRNPIKNIWSIQICDRECPQLTANGQGKSKADALHKALNNFIKHLSTHYFWTNFYLGDALEKNNTEHSPKERWFKTQSNGEWPDNILNDELKYFYNSIGELSTSHLIDVNTADKERGIRSQPYTNLKTSDVTYFPVNIIDNLYLDNGIATANTSSQAKVLALSEILENYVKSKIISEGLSLPKIPEKFVEQYTNHIENIIEAGYDLIIQDASLEGKYPVVSLTLLNPKNQGVYTCFAAHPLFDNALERCFHLLFKNRELDQFNNFSEAAFDMDEIASPQNLEHHFLDTKGIIHWNFLRNESSFNFIDWSQKYSNLDEETVFHHLCDIIYNDDCDIYISEYNALDQYVCRMIIPRFSELYPVDDLIWENNNAGIVIRKQILKTNKTLDECSKLIDDLEDLNLADEFLVTKLIAMPADTDNIFTDLCISELILLLALKTQDNERIQEACEWLLDYKKINPQRLKIYHCINTLFQLDGMAHYRIALEKLYTREVLNDALALIDGDDVFSLESEWVKHALLIQAYNKLN